LPAFGEVDRAGVARAINEKTEAAIKRLDPVRRIMAYFFMTRNSQK
jgi:hypothetical protein